MSGDVYEVTMPKLGETVTEGVVSQWLKQVGDTVAFDDPLFEVSTDKVDSEVPSPYDGVLLEILVPAGDTVPIGTPIARIGEPGRGRISGQRPAWGAAVPGGTAAGGRERPRPGHDFRFRRRRPDPPRGRRASDRGGTRFGSVGRSGRSAGHRPGTRRGVGAR